MRTELYGPTAESVPDRVPGVDLLADLQRRLDARAVPETKEWWERYLRHAIEFRGVKMADIRAAVLGWHAEHEPDDPFAAALRLIRQPLAEDKLAGIVLIQEILLPAGRLDCGADLAAFARLFDDGAIADWNTCDWFCVRMSREAVRSAIKKLPAEDQQRLLADHAA